MNKWQEKLYCGFLLLPLNTSLFLETEAKKNNTSKAEIIRSLIDEYQKKLS